jgi:hypothetical protein
MSDFGELILVLGDYHIPHRAAMIPEKFKKMLVPNKMQHIFCTGNLITKEQHDELRALGRRDQLCKPDMHVLLFNFCFALHILTYLHYILYLFCHFL